MPAEVGRLTCLQTLPLFVVGPTRGGDIQELEPLKELRGELAITKLELVKGRNEAEKANLREKAKIKALQFTWSRIRESCNNDEEVLDGLQPHSSIESLDVMNYWGETFPSWLLMNSARSYDDSFVLNNLVNLRLDGCKNCNEIPKLGQLPLLKILEISRMDNVKCIGTEFYGRSSEQILFPSLKEFYLCSMFRLAEWMAPLVGDSVVFPRLCCLEISGCPNLKSIPASHLSSLVQLEIDSCDDLEYLCDELNEFLALEDLRISDCADLVFIPSLQGRTSLKTLMIKGCHQLTSLPEGLKSCTSLEHLSILCCPLLTHVPEDLSELCSLIYLEVTKCPSLIYFPNDIFCCISHLKDVRVGPFLDELEHFPGLDSIQDLPLLEELRIFGWDKLKFLPDQLQNLTSLKSLCIHSFNELESLPEWLGSFSSLQFLEIWNCRNLKYLPATPHCFSKVMRLHIVSCPLLQINCAKGSGSQWSKISNIPQIFFY